LSAVGDYPNQGSGTDGLRRYANGQPLDGKDVVVWYTASFTHVPTVEEFPVMTRETVGFKLRPDGFFNENPGLDVPPAG
jgi:primary-amine oxidase